MDRKVLLKCDSYKSTVYILNKKECGWKRGNSTEKCIWLHFSVLFTNPQQLVEDKNELPNECRKNIKNRSQRSYEPTVFESHKNYIIIVTEVKIFMDMGCNKLGRNKNGNLSKIKCFEICVQGRMGGCI